MDIAIKKYLIDSGLFTLYQQIQKSLRLLDYNKDNGTDYRVPFSKEECYNYIDNIPELDEFEHALYNLSNAYYQRIKRLNKRISQMLEFDCLFLTITFTDNTLNSTTIETRRKYVRRWLEKNCVCYVANIDFGKTNHREHYHAVVLPYDKLDYTSFGKGAVNGQKIRSVEDYKALSKYVAKLTNHAIKETTKNHKIIYSRQEDFYKFLCKKNNYTPKYCII